MARAPVPASTPKEPSQEDLSAFRGPDHAAVAPPPVEDGAEPPQIAAPEQAAAVAPAAPATEAAPEAKPFADNRRAEIAARFKRDREEERARVVPLNHIPHIHGDAPPQAPSAATTTDDITDPGHPDYIAGEDDRRAGEEAEPAAAPTAREKPAPAPFQFQPPKQGDQPAQTLLKVNGSTFGVSDEQLLQYAEFTPEEAAGVPRQTLINIAQKNIAATMRLRDSKAQRGEDRADLAPAAQPAAHRQPAPSPTAPRTPPADMKELVRKVQLGDEDEAADAILDFGNQLVDMAVNRMTANRRNESVVESHQRGLREVQSEYPQIFENDILAGAHTIAVAKEIANEINARVQPLDDAQFAAICNNPQLAAQLHAAALAEGRPLAMPDEINRRAATTIAATFGLPSRTPSAPPPAAPQAQPRRQDLKRQAFTNTARATPPQPFVPQTEQQPIGDREAARERAIQRMREARHQA